MLKKENSYLNMSAGMLPENLVAQLWPISDLSHPLATLTSTIDLTALQCDRGFKPLA